MSHIAPVSFKAGTTIAAYRIVQMDTATANRVIVTAANTNVPIGVTSDTVLETGLAIPVVIAGIAKVYFNDSCASGSLVTCDAAGRGIAFAAVSTGSYFIGTLIGPKVEDTGTIAEVLLNIHRQTID